MEKLNILVVDNNPRNLLTYSTILSNLGEHVIQVASGEEALKRLLETEIAILLTDVNMPNTDGFELADMVNEHPHCKDIAIIFVSGSRLSDSDRLKGYAHGAVDYITIPVVPELLQAKVRMFGELYRKKRQLKVLNEQMQRLSARMMAALDDERRRIARELHDGLGQQLTLAKITVDGIKVPEARHQAEEASEQINEAIRQVRTISHLLHPPLLDEIGLVPAIEWYLDGLTKRGGIETAIEVEPTDFPRLPQQHENALYRITQEAVTNAFRHSGGKRICVVLRKYHNAVALAVKDNGKGVPENLAALHPGILGIGVSGMKQRATELGGELRIFNGGQGAVVEVVLPVKSSDPTN